MREQYRWTKEKLAQIIDFWEGNTILEISQKLDIPKKSVAYAASWIRKCGIPLSRKRVSGGIVGLINELKKERGL